MEEDGSFGQDVFTREGFLIQFNSIDGAFVRYEASMWMWATIRSFTVVEFGSAVWEIFKV